MPFTRKFLQGLDIEADAVEKIIKEHVSVTDGLKDDIDELEEKVKSMAKIQKELEEKEARIKELETGKGDDEYKEKYETIKAEYESYKETVEKKETDSAKGSAIKEILKTIGISEDVADTILEATKLDDYDLTKDGKIKGAEAVSENLKKKWEKFITEESEGGAEFSHGGGEGGKGGKGKKMTREEIFKIKDPVERQKAILDNQELFIRKE